MANKVKQFRYYGENEKEKNSPSDVKRFNFTDGSVFANTLPILQLGIQTLPGTRFFLNGSSDPIIIGSTGIYELDLQNKTEITGLTFEPKLFNLIDGANGIDPVSGAYLIVDIVYEEMED